MLGGGSAWDGRAAMRRTGWTCRTAALWLAAVAVASAASPKTLTPEQELELKMFTEQLADPARSAKTKSEAAELLLTRAYPEAAEALRKFLADAANRPAQVAVAEAVARHGEGHAGFVEPLMAMLTGPEPSVRPAAARALVTYKNQGVTEKLIAIANDKKADKAVRLVMISALQRVLEKQAIDALVQLVSDRDPAIRAAAAESLAKLTNIRTFGTDPRRWRKWWATNQGKPASAWLADLAESLGREKARLEEENLKLRQRLAQAMIDSYAATAPPGQDQLLMEILKDPLPDVRLVGVTLTGRKIAAGGSASATMLAEVARMLSDSDERVRREAALLEANIGDPNATERLLGRLALEELPEVKRGLLTALSQLRSPKALKPILAEVGSRDELVAAAAAAALARNASAQPLVGEVRDQAVKDLLSRYEAAESSPNGTGAELREALLTAMGVIADPKFTAALKAALKDPAATARLAAVKGLAQFRQAELADAIVPLANDEDRGVRQAALETLGTLAGDKHRATILQRTDPASEPDATVREKAWTVLMAVLAKSDAATLAEVYQALAKRPDAATQRIQVQQMLVQALRAAQSPQLPDALRQLGGDLMAASRPAEAAAPLGEAHALYAAAKAPAAEAVYLEWVDALLKANDPTVIKALADPARASAFAEVLARLDKRLKELIDEGRYAPAILLAREVVRQVPKQLTAEQRRQLEARASDADARQFAADTERVAQLAGRLLAADSATSKAAADELKAMGDRAVKPLVLELQKLTQAPTPNAPAEKAIVDVLMQIAPKLTGYDPTAPKADRLQRIDGWLKVL